MSKKTARNIFIGGTVIFWIIFVGLTVDTMKKIDRRSPPITEAVNRGKMAWQKYDCIGCHTILGNGSYFAPDLTKVADKKPESYLVKWLTNPKGVRKDATMPKLGITEAEARDLIAFLKWNSGVDTNGWPPEPILAKAAAASARQAASPGALLYQANACSACHTISGIGGTTGPELTHIGSRRDKAWLVKHFKDPQAVTPGSAMPSFSHLGEAKLEQLSDYLLTLE